MLKDARAFSGFSVDDVPRATEFYGTTLGLEFADAALGVEGADVPTGLELHLGPGTKVMVYPKPDHTPATFTILSFLVKDVERAVDELTATRSPGSAIRPATSCPSSRSDPIGRADDAG